MSTGRRSATTGITAKRERAKWREQADAKSGKVASISRM
jgi:hypothetical protein